MLNLYTGKVLSNNEIKKIILEDEIIKAKKYILRILNRRIYSKYEILKKLRMKRFSENIIPNVVLWLENKEYINDELFATIWSQSRLNNKPIGRYRLNYELRLKGIDQKIIQKVLDKTYNEIDELTLARNLIKNKITSSEIKNIRIDPEKIYNFLLRRGFSRGVSKNICDELKSKQASKIIA